MSNAIKLSNVSDPKDIVIDEDFFKKFHISSEVANFFRSAGLVGINGEDIIEFEGDVLGYFSIIEERMDAIRSPSHDLYIQNGYLALEENSDTGIERIWTRVSPTELICEDKLHDHKVVRITNSEGLTLEETWLSPSIDDSEEDFVVDKVSYEYEDDTAEILRVTTLTSGTAEYEYYFDGKLYKVEDGTGSEILKYVYNYDDNTLTIGTSVTHGTERQQQANRIKLPKQHIRSRNTESPVYESREKIPGLDYIIIVVIIAITAMVLKVTGALSLIGF